MPVTSIGDYTFESKDVVENFHGNILTFWHWEDHLMFCAAFALPFPPDMRFGEVVETVLPGLYGYHPETASIQWDRAEWTLDGEPFTPDMDKSLADNGVGHKSVVRFRTPGLTGIGGTCT